MEQRSCSTLFVMPIPLLRDDGTLPPGIYRATFTETFAVFGQGAARQDKAELLKIVVEAARQYPTIKRVLVWGSFVTNKPDPNDLDYSIVVGKDFSPELIRKEHRRFFVPAEARQYYGVDKGYFVISDYPIVKYAELMMFICQNRQGQWHGIVEIDNPLKE